MIIEDLNNLLVSQIYCSHEIEGNIPPVCLVFNLTLTIGKLKKDIRLFHIESGVRSVYDILYVNQNIACRIFVAIQSGSGLESPNVMDPYFAQHDNKPEVWIRGIFGQEYQDLNLQALDDAGLGNVFNPVGIYNHLIKEFHWWSWSIFVDYPEIKFSCVRAYAMEPLPDFLNQEYNFEEQFFEHLLDNGLF